MAEAQVVELRAGHVVKRYYELLQEFGAPEPSKREKFGIFNNATLYLRWCRKMKIDDPLAFMKFRFVAGARKKIVPRMSRLRVNKMAEAWLSQAEGAHLEEQALDALTAEAGTLREQRIRSLQVITRAQESVRASYYPSRSDRCMAQLELSGGFDPRSAYCPTCPVAVYCSAKLVQQEAFDVPSLRAGRLQFVPPEVARAASK